jgi:hypothetical protein
MIRLAVAVTPVDALDEHAGPFDDDDGPVHNGRFGLLPCVRTHSRFGPQTAQSWMEKRWKNDDPIDYCCAVVCTRWRGVGIFSLARVSPRGPFEPVRGPLRGL